MAYAVLSSLMHTLEQLLQPDPPLVCGSEQQLQSVYHILCSLQAFLEDTTKRTKDKETLKVLEKKIRDVVYKVEDTVDSSLRSFILADCIQNQETALKSFDQELQRAEKEVDSLRQDLMQMEFKKHGSKYTEATISSLSGKCVTEQNTVVGIKDDFNKILDQLTAQTNELIVIPVVGMGGIGKTTLARKVYHDSSITFRFDTLAWVTITEEYNERQMLLEVVSSISHDQSNYQSMSKDQLAEIVYRGLKGRRFLIVIDDLWSTEAWDQMQRVFPNDNDKSRILLTTRLNYVADYASTDIPSHNMSFLSLDDSWNLFNERLFGKDPCPPQLTKIGKHIIQKCRGLPLSIVIIAGLLGKMDPTHDNWKQIEENLNSFFGTVSEQCQAILSVSYSYLPQHLKACFLYVGGFPEDMEIGVSKLTRLWIGEHFIKARSYKQLEVRAEEYLEELIERSLILVGRRGANGRIKTCKIHDLLRQLCIREAQIENVWHVIGDNVPRRVIANFFRDWCRLHSLKPENGTMSAVRSFVYLRMSLRFGDNFFESYPSDSHFKFLKVLEASEICCDFTNVITQLVHLRYVAAYIGRDLPPSISNLWNLQTLILHQIRDVRQGWLISPGYWTMPRRAPYIPLEIWNMSQMRHLNVGMMYVPSPIVAEVHSTGGKKLFLNYLRTLVLRSSFLLKDILLRTPSLTKLRILSIELVAEWSQLLSCVIHLKEVEILDIHASSDCPLLRFPQRDVFPPNLKRLRFSATRIPWDDMNMLASLPNLDVLKIDNASQGTYWRLNEEDVFQKLKYLRIGYTNLETWEATCDNFAMLEQLVLRGCGKLEEIPQGIGEITTLKMIQLDECNHSVETSAKQIQEEQQSWGNYELVVVVNVGFLGFSLPMWINKHPFGPAHYMT